MFARHRRGVGIGVCRPDRCNAEERSSDGRGVIVAERFSPVNGGNPQILSVDPTRGGVRVLTAGSQDLIPDISSDGRKTVFERCERALNCGEIGKINIWIMRADRSHAHPLTACDGTVPWQLRSDLLAGRAFRCLRPGPPRCSGGQPQRGVHHARGRHTGLTHHLQRPGRVAGRSAALLPRRSLSRLSARGADGRRPASTARRARLRRPCHRSRSAGAEVRQFAIDGPPGKSNTSSLHVNGTDHRL